MTSKNYQCLTNQTKTTAAYGVRKWFFKVYSLRSFLFHLPSIDSFEVINDWNCSFFLEDLVFAYTCLRAVWYYVHVFTLCLILRTCIYVVFDINSLQLCKLILCTTVSLYFTMMISIVNLNLFLLFILINSTCGVRWIPDLGVSKKILFPV